MANARYKSDGTRCSHKQIGLHERLSTGKTTGGQTRYWLVCSDCGFEVGPFTTVEKAGYWELTRGRADGPSLAYRIMQEPEKRPADGAQEAQDQGVNEPEQQTLAAPV